VKIQVLPLGRGWGWGGRSAECNNAMNQSVSTVSITNEIIDIKIREITSLQEVVSCSIAWGYEPPTFCLQAADLPQVKVSPSVTYSYEVLL